MSKWNEKILGEVVSISKGKLTKQSEAPESGFLPLINTDAVNGKTKIYSDSIGAVICENIDVLMLWDGERSGLVTIGHSGVVGSTFARLKPFEFIHPKYLYYFLDNKFSWIQNQRTGTGVPHVPKDLDKILWIKFPEDKSEQRQIAEILSTCDSVIEKTQAAIAKYKAIKQGMIHDLFTRGIDLQTGKLRPKYEDAPELYKESILGCIPIKWESLQLNQICSMKSGEGITSVRIWEMGDYPVYGGNGLRGYTNTYTHEGEYTLIGRQGALCGNINRVSGKFYASEHAVVVTVESEINVDWLSQKLDTMNLNRYSEASAQPGLSVNKILRVFVSKPPFEEQKVIAERLISIDNKLQVEQDYLLKLQHIKAGLMGDLLSGKKEVKVQKELVTQNQE